MLNHLYRHVVKSLFQVNKHKIEALFLTPLISLGEQSNCEYCSSCFPYLTAMNLCTHVHFLPQHTFQGSFMIWCNNFRLFIPTMLECITVHLAHVHNNILHPFLRTVPSSAVMFIKLVNSPPTFPEVFSTFAVIPQSLSSLIIHQFIYFTLQLSISGGPLTEATGSRLSLSWSNVWFSQLKCSLNVFLIPVSYNVEEYFHEGGDYHLPLSRWMALSRDVSRL